jgi:3-oxoacyl-[acyl-carrier protein] reductase
MRLVGRTAVITGASRGLGKAIADRYLAEGASVVCGARTPGAVETVDDVGDRLRFHQVDVTEPSSVAELMQYTVDTFGQIDILVSNAGVSRDGRVEKLPPKEWDEMVATNLTGVFLCTREAVPHMNAAGGGRIINLSSSMASRVAIGAAGYCATKAAVEMFTKVCAIELAAKGILVNCLAPGVIDEGMGHELVNNQRVWDVYRKRFALGRPGHAAEVADAAVFLASTESSYVNGHVLEVNGGLLWA